MPRSRRSPGGGRNAAGAKNENNVAVAHTPMVSDEDLDAAKKVTYCLLEEVPELGYLW